MAADETMPDRIRECGMYARAGTVELRRREASVYPAQLIVCARPHFEPVCGAKVRARKGNELAQLIQAHEAAGGSVHFTVVTSGSHHLTDSLADSQAVLEAELRQILRDVQGWRRLKTTIGYVGHGIGREWTYSLLEGHNPHANLLWFTEGPLWDDGLELRHWCYERAKRATDKAGRYLHPEAGVVTIANCGAADRLGEYVAKLQEGDTWGAAQEMTRADAKTAAAVGLVPFELAAAYYTTGDLEWRMLWDEWASGILSPKGLAPPVVRLSRGLRAHIGSAPEVDLDEERLALAEVGGYLVAEIPWHTWLRIRQAGMGPAVLTAALDGLDAINELLAQHGLGWANPPLTAAQRHNTKARTR